MSDDAMKALQAEIAALKAQVRELAEPKPASPTRPAFDYSARFGMPPSAAAEMSRAADDRLIADIVRDHRRGVSKPSGLIVGGCRPARTVPSANGWARERPLPSAPPGYSHIERLMDAADAVDRRGRR